MNRSSLWFKLIVFNFLLFINETLTAPATNSIDKSGGSGDNNIKTGTLFNEILDYKVNSINDRDALVTIKKTKVIQSSSETQTNAPKTNNDRITDQCKYEKFLVEDKNLEFYLTFRSSRVYKS